MLMPLMAMAQNNWELPEARKAELTQSKVKGQKAEKKAQPKADKTSKKGVINDEDRPYLAGAVPVVDGKVVYTVDVDMPGKTADEVYDRAYSLLEMMTKDEHQTGISKIALVNKAEHSVVATFEEWLVFADKMLQLDRTLMTYVILAECSSGKCHMEIQRINYKYDLLRHPQYLSADDIITDKQCVSKDGTKLKRGYIKFRKKTVDRMKELQKTIQDGMHSGLRFS